MTRSEEEQLENYISTVNCPKCNNKSLNINLMVCHDPECCGGWDWIECDNCNLDIEGYFYTIEDIKEKLK